MEEKGKIVVMLDLQGTLDGINDSSAHVFMQQVEQLRNKFSASEALLFISSQAEDERELHEGISCLKRNLLSNIKLDDCYYLNGYVNPYTMESVSVSGINGDKLSVLQGKYFGKEELKFVGIIDDNILAMSVLPFQNVCPMVHIYPSQRCEEYLDTSFFSYGTMTYGFNGVVECIASYLKTIQNLDTNEIFTCQKQDLVLISCILAIQLLRDKRYKELRRYVEADKVCRDGYGTFAYSIGNVLYQKEYSAEEKEDLFVIAQLVCSRLDENRRKQFYTILLTLTKNAI